MKSYELPSVPSAVRTFAIALGVLFLAAVAQAVPYASCVSNVSGTISYILNQDAQDVKVVFDGGGTGNTNSYGALTRGQYSFSLGGHTTYQVIVINSAPSSWVKISDETNYNILRYFSPRGVAVSQSTSNLNTFGRIYVANATPGTAGVTTAPTSSQRATGRGLYAVNPDYSDPYGQGTAVRNAGITFDTSTVTFRGTGSPYRIAVGKDGKVYVCDYSTNTAMLYQVDEHLTSNVQVLLGQGAFANPTVHTTIGRAFVTGTSADGNLVIYAINGYDPFYNRVVRYDINAGTFPWNTAPTTMMCPGICTVNHVTTDFDIGPNGKYYVIENRSAGTDADSVRVYDTDGATLLFGSFTGPGQLGNPDPLRQTRSVKVTADNKTMILLTDNNHVRFLPLDSNGLPDYPNMTVLGGSTNFSGTTAAGQYISLDAAGNLYAVSSGMEKMVIYSPGGYSVAVTSWDGTKGGFQLIKPSTDVNVVATTPTTSMDTSQPPGVFTITRAGDTTPALQVGYTLTGTATNNIHYQLLSGTATIPASASSVDVNVVAIPITPAGPQRTVIMALNSSNTYSAVSPSSATVAILDTNTPCIKIERVDTQMYERTNDYARFRLTRLGLIATDVTVNISYGGSGTLGTDFDGPASVLVPNGSVTATFQITPIVNGSLGDRTVTASVAPAGGGEYTVCSPSASAAVTIVNSDLPVETVLYSDNFEADSSANWNVFFATTNGAAVDYTLNNGVNGPGTWPFDYSSLAVPSAPHSAGGTTLGLYMTVNKNDTAPAAAGLNLYPVSGSFSGNYAVRFDMFLIENDTASTTEYAVFGINHSGTKTNWFRYTTGGFVGVDPVGWNFDGVFYGVEADGANASGGDGDYVAHSSPTTVTRNPTVLKAVNAPTLTGVFKSPPWTPGAVGGGAPANIYGSATPIWADVEVSQINNVIALKINQTVILTYTNATGYTSGKIMLGYTDAYDSRGSSGGSVIYDNLRVVSLASPVITSISNDGVNVTVKFSAGASDVPAQFKLQSTGTMPGAFADVSATITSLGSPNFQAVRPVSGNQQYYRINKWSY